MLDSGIFIIGSLKQHQRKRFLFPASNHDPGRLTHKGRSHRAYSYPTARSGPLLVSVRKKLLTLLTGEYIDCFKIASFILPSLLLNLQEVISCLGVVEQVCDHSDGGGGGRKILSLRQAAATERDLWV